MKRNLIASIFGATMLALCAGTGMAATLDEIKARGTLNCGVPAGGVVGFSFQDSSGHWAGIDAGFCRAVGAGVLRDGHAVRFVPLLPKDGLISLQSGEVDLLAPSASWIMPEQPLAGVTFPVTTFFDVQGFLVPADLGVSYVAEFGDFPTICVLKDTASETNLVQFFSSINTTYEPVPTYTAFEMEAQYFAGACDIASAPLSYLAALRLAARNPAGHKILPDTIAQTNFGPVVRQGDEQWQNIVEWTHYVMLHGEELGVGSHSSTGLLMGSDNSEIQTLLGASGNLGAGLGLESSFGLDVIGWVGNYSEIFEENVGSNTAFGMSRGDNALVSNGGRQQAPPLP
jgi:general L-amino acid transport system substrate-binding protein